MDFITDLPLVHGYDIVVVTVDRFTKMAQIFPLSTEEISTLFLKNVVQLHGVLDDVTLDRKPQFVSLATGPSYT